MNLANFRLPAVDLSPSQRETLEKYVPLVVVGLALWMIARGLKRIFWVAFAMFWAFGGVGGLRHLLH